MALDLKIELFTDDECENLYLSDSTGLYSSDNTGGYNSPNLAIANVDLVVITVTILGTTLVYELTVSSGTITAATATLGSGTPVNILSLLESTTWPFPDATPFNLTPTVYSANFPAFEDGVWDVEYNVQYTGGPESYTTDDLYLNKCATCCCISDAMTSINIHNKEELVGWLYPNALLTVAQYATDNGNVSQANSFLTKASDICSGASDCGCGCS